jgi:Pyruvate/2-oxoacid:ferredoxin oxidoreductase delta subunit
MTPDDDHLQKILEKHSAWKREGKIAFAGRILPVQEAFRLEQWILPTQQALQILKDAHTFALADCTCRLHYRRCSHPIETCLLMGELATAWVDAGKARCISIDMAREVLLLANIHGLVHQAAYQPQHSLWAVCSCCSCCCYRLQMLKFYNRIDLVVRSSYYAIVDEQCCTNCGQCIPRCNFGGQVLTNGRLEFHKDKCYGCGLCVTACPEHAIRLEQRGI